MATVFAPYRKDVFNNILDLGDANATFRDKGGPELVATALGDLFSKFDVADVFVVCLVHIHFGLAEGQLLVDTNGTAVAWDMTEELSTTASPSSSSCCCYSKYDGSVHPMSWTFDDAGQLIPYEFCFVPFAEATKATASLNTLLGQHRAFFTAFRKCLDTHGLRSVLGLRLRRAPSGSSSSSSSSSSRSNDKDNDDQNGTMEVTQGHANITYPMPLDLVGSRPLDPPHDRYIQATWAYNQKEGGYPGQVFGFCVSACYNTQTGQVHFKVHS